MQPLPEYRTIAFQDLPVSWVLKIFFVVSGKVVVRDIVSTTKGGCIHKDRLVRSSSSIISSLRYGLCIDGSHAVIV